jgi:hypothetical protein
MKIIKKLVITNLLFLAFNSFADPFDAFKEIAKELDKSVKQKEETPNEQPQKKTESQPIKQEGQSKEPQTMKEKMELQKSGYQKEQDNADKFFREATIFSCRNDFYSNLYVFSGDNLYGMPNFEKMDSKLKASALDSLENTKRGKNYGDYWIGNIISRKNDMVTFTKVTFNMRGDRKSEFDLKKGIVYEEHMDNILEIKCKRVKF